MSKNKFKLHSEYKPSGDQPEAIKKITSNIQGKTKDQVLLGATGTGKTFTMANVIQNVNMPTIILAHNKTLASQLYGELKEFFPENKIEYFVSYFDYYQPEAYIPGSDTYIEKDSKINEEIDRMRHSATAALFEREDVVIVSSVSCIYSVGDPETYKNLTISLREDQTLSQKDFIYNLIDLQYERQDINFKRGSFRVRGDIVDLIAAHNEKVGYKIEFFGDEIESIIEFDVITGKKKAKLKHLLIYPATHYVADPEFIKEVSEIIREDMEKEVVAFKEQNKLLEAQRLEQRTKYDLEMLKEVGSCNGIENYTRYFSQKEPGETPYTLLDFFPKDYLMIVDESHVTLPQVRGMYNGDHARKQNLVDYGFRLQSAVDNRPLKFEEFVKKQSYAVYVSATPNEYEIQKSNNIVIEQIIRPTGLLDPIIEIRKKENQIDDIIKEIKSLNNNKMLITTLTKKMAEDLTAYLKEQNIKVAYLHSDIKTLQRIQIINELRAGKYDVLIGINLLREGLDIPEVDRVLIMDADKEGFLRSTTSLIQTVGRAARNENGKVLFYADKITDSMQKTIDETKRRRTKQMEFNKEHNITPTTIKKKITELDLITEQISYEDIKKSKKNKEQIIKDLTREMEEFSKNLNYEEAARVRDIILELKGK